MIKAIPTGFSGLWHLTPRCVEDARGVFVKTFHRPAFLDLGIPFEPKEEFFSISAKDVVRGMHFQMPPAATAKLVYCITGSALDVVLDLRRKSPTLGLSYDLRLSAANRSMLFIPTGFAHGFLALEDNTTMIYMTDFVHVPARDTGIAWDSFGFDWPVRRPILSDRDQRFPRWSEFHSPF